MSYHFHSSAHIKLVRYWQYYKDYSPVVSGQSTQLVGPGPVCSSDVALYQCTSSGSLITWTVISACGGGTGRSFGSYSKTGTMFNVTQCNSVLSFSLTSITISSISSTLTIHRPLSLNGTRIICLDETAQVFVIASKME